MAKIKKQQKIMKGLCELDTEISTHVAIHVCHGVQSTQANNIKQQDIYSSIPVMGSSTEALVSV